MQRRHGLGASRATPLRATATHKLDAELSTMLSEQKPSPALQPREVIKTMLSALHRSNFDQPRARFGAEIALRFLAPSNPASQATPERFAAYLSQSWYQMLLDWEEYRWEGDTTLLGESEAYQQVGVRSSPEEAWVAVRWILVRVPFYATTDQWMVGVSGTFPASQPLHQRSQRWRPPSPSPQRAAHKPGLPCLATRSASHVSRVRLAPQAVFVEEPDGDEAFELGEVAPVRRSLMGAVEAPDTAPNFSETPGDVVLAVMKAVRTVDEPYALAGAEVAIRYCSPSNRASRLSPQAFSTYLREPWYAILTEWEEIELDDDPEVSADGSVVQQDVLVRRSESESWTIVNWQLSRHSGRWLTDSLTITE